MYIPQSYSYPASTTSSSPLLSPSSATIVMGDGADTVDTTGDAEDADEAKDGAFDSDDGGLGGMLPSALEEEALDN
jgi:hypothetical protein